MQIEVLTADELLICELTKISATEAAAKILSRKSAAPHSGTTLILAHAKNKTIDVVVEKAVELGVRQIVIFHAARTQGKDATEKLAARTERLERIAEAALKQSESLSGIPSFSFADSLTEALTKLHESPAANPLEWRLLLCPPRKQAPNFPDFLSLKSRPQTAIENPAVFADSFIIVGPEGGLSDEEEQIALNFAYQPLVLSENVLRVETAAILGTGIVNWLRSVRR